MDVYLMNEKNTTVKVKTTDSSDDVLEVSCFCCAGIYFYIMPYFNELQKVAKKIELQDEFTYYFALFFKRFDEVTKSWKSIRLIATCCKFIHCFLLNSYAFLSTI